jgi:hypothetical protein
VGPLLVVDAQPLARQRLELGDRFEEMGVEDLRVERYHYERSGDGYNVIFREPSLDFGMRRFVVYNPLDRQRVTVHEQDRLLLDDAGLDADNAGHTGGSGLAADTLEAVPVPELSGVRAKVDSASLPGSTTNRTSRSSEKSASLPAVRGREAPQRRIIG